MTMQPGNEDQKAVEAGDGRVVEAAVSGNDKPSDAAKPTSASSAEAPTTGATAGKTHTSVTVQADPDDPDMVIIRTRKRKRKKSGKHKSKLSAGKRRALIVVGVIVGILAAAAIAFAIAVNVGNVNLHNVFGGLQNAPEEVDVRDDGQTVEYQGRTYRYNENVVSMLFIGRDDESSYAFDRPDATCADANVLMTLDTSNNKMRAIMIPRNSWVPVDLYDADQNYVGTRDLQLTLSHAVLLDTPEECAANTTKSVSYLFYNLPITYYIDLDKQVVKQASTAVGGVQVEALENIPGETYSAGDTVLLEGDAAYRYVNYRNTDAFESVLARQERQVQFVKSFASKLSQLGAGDIVNLYNSVSGDVVTNVGASEIAYLAYCFVTGNNSSIEVAQLTGTTDVYTETDGIEYERYYLDEASVIENTLASFYTEVD